LGTPLSVVVTRRGGAGAANLACVVSGAGRRCGDGDVITVTATYDSGVLGAFAGMVPGFTSSGTIQRTATARFE
ncbi:MAG: hypothetical protein ACRDY5_07740, partial [Acidimicrobiales bacterium]